MVTVSDYIYKCSVCVYVIVYDFFESLHDARLVSEDSARCRQRSVSARFYRVFSRYIEEILQLSGEHSLQSVPVNCVYRLTILTWRRPGRHSAPAKQPCDRRSFDEVNSAVVHRLVNKLYFII
ncbi:uncharacterized protein LOC114938357 [Nylanderia fulva]|uniref:uncharacterized protein LOC114938357 n=1 Tax=Nylanderia fulva TaxID=613905 RepID=UPI0010FB4DB4|nr:uncharacterized protein LOC114938357 [Nylanderia fulva]